MDILIQASQFILSLSLLIILHELGHFIPAKLFKTRVEKFYLFFDPWFSIIKKKIGGTEYGIGWLPLGGYVKISGMIDESMDKEQMEQPAQPWEFRSKPAWQRLIIMIGGVTVNVILAIVIYSGMLMHYGEVYVLNKDVSYGISTDSTGYLLGLQDGDKILSIDGREIERFHEIDKELVLSENEILVDRDGEQITIPIIASEKSKVIKEKSRIVTYRIPFIVGGFADSSAAKIAGLEEGDSLVAVNNEKLLFFDQYPDKIASLKGDSITLGFYRNGAPQSISFLVPESGQMGVGPNGEVDRFFKVYTQKYSFFEALPAGLNRTVTSLTDYVRQFKLITNPETGAYKEVGGFLMILKQFDSTQWNWERFWAFTAFLSIMLAFLNILPIPALDGGHVVFVLWEMITGRKPSQKVLEYAQMVGFFILLALILLANGNDILKLFRG